MTHDLVTYPPFCDPYWLEAWLEAFAPGEDTLAIGPITGLLRDDMRVHGLKLRALFSPTNDHTPRYDRPLGLVQTDAILGPAFTDTHKGTLTHMRPPTSSVDRVTEPPAKPAWVVFPTYRTEASVELDPLAKARAFLRLADNSFNYHILGTTDFDMLAEVMDACSCYELTYSSPAEATKALEDLSK